MAEIGYKGAELDLLVRQGGTFRTIIRVKNAAQLPVDLTDYIFRGQVRKRYDSATVAASFICEITDAVNGVLQIELDAASTALLVAGDDETQPESIYQWDLEAEHSSGFVTPYLYGAVKVFREVTKT